MFKGKEVCRRVHYGGLSRSECARPVETCDVNYVNERAVVADRRGLLSVQDTLSSRCECLLHAGVDTLVCVCGRAVPRVFA